MASQSDNRRELFALAYLSPLSHKFHMPFIWRVQKKLARIFEEIRPTKEGDISAWSLSF